MRARRRVLTSVLLPLLVALGMACQPAAPARGPAPAAPPAPAQAAAPAPPAAVSAPAAPAASPALPAQPETVRMGVLGSTSDAGIFIAADLGYFKEQAIELETTNFDSAARMVAPLGAGQLEVGAGAHSAGLFNAVARGIDVRLVADKGSTPVGHGFQALVFRKELADSGRLRSPGDLRGMNVATTARGTSVETALNLWLSRNGLSVPDVNIVELGFPQHAEALGNGSVDASITIEPFLTRVVDLGVGIIYQRTDELIPGFQVAELIYSGQFIREQPDLARRLMIAYLKAVRFYNDAFARGDAAKRQEAVAILARNTPVKEAALYDRMALPGLHPDGRINMDTLAMDQDYFISSGLQQTRIDLNVLVDHSFADAAVQALGPYR